MSIRSLSGNVYRPPIDHIGLVKASPRKVMDTYAIDGSPDIGYVTFVLTA